MGIVHKLKPEVLNFILENKQKNPALSCRTLAQLILEKLQVKVSKSSINAIFKEHNLSMPIGRRQKHKKKKFNMPALPVIEGTKAVMTVSAPQPVQEETTKEEVVPEPKKEEAAHEEQKAEISLEEKRLKEAEEWAIKLREDEQARIKEKLKLEKQKHEEDVHKKSEETEVKALLEEAARVKAKEEQRQRDLEKTAQEAAEKKRLEEEVIKAKEQAEKLEEERLAKISEEEEQKREIEKATQAQAEKKRLEDEASKAVAEKKRLEEEAKKAEEEKLAEEAALKAEKEKWAKLAEEEHKAKQQKPEEIVLPKEEKARVSALPQESNCPGAVLLKALDNLIGGSNQINEAICKETGALPENSLNLTEAVIFRKLFGKDNLELLWKLIDRQFSAEELDNYYTQIKELKNLRSNISDIFSIIFTEAREVKLHFTDGSVANFDGQLHSVWSAQSIPYDFSCPVYELKNNLNRGFLKTGNLVLFSAPGYDVVPKDFFNLLLNFISSDKYPDTLTLSGSKLEEIDSRPLNNQENSSLVFGLWPWQFNGTRKVKRIGEFDLRRIESIGQDMYLAEIEIDLLLASTNQSISLKGCAIKTNPAEKIRLVVLSTSQAVINIEELAEIYLSHWPNLDEAYHDYSRKIELFSYAGNGQKFFSKDNSGIELEITANLQPDDIFTAYIKILDVYLRWYFFPGGYTDKSFVFMSEHFYSLPVELITGKNKLIAQIQVGQGYQSSKDLEYLISRLNERQIELPKGLRLYFGSAFK